MNRTRSSFQDERGRFRKGAHWRPHQRFRERDWLAFEYVVKQRSMGDIAAEFGVSEPAIRFWLRRHGIPRRSMSEARQVKHWGLSGSANGMSGRVGDQNPNWRGGVTAERQLLYVSAEWAEAAKTVWRRDAATCQRCGKRSSGRGDLDLHHIVSFAVPQLRTDPGNLILLCRVCHRWVHSRANVDHAFLREWEGGDAE